jgi:hypothetical protein
MPFWSATSTTLANDQMYVNNTYKDANGKNKLTTISSANTTGYVPIDPNSTDPIVKKTSYAVQNDGKITYQYEDGTGNKTQYNSIQQIANDGLKGYSDATTAKIKNSMQSNLSTSATTQKVGPSTATTDPNSSTPQTTGTQQDLLNNASVKDGGVRKTYENLRYPIDRDTKQDHILFTMMRYAPRAFDANLAASKSNGTFGDRIGGGTGGAREIYGSVSLPIQPNIADANSVGWHSDDINAIEASLQSLFKSAITGNVQQGVDKASEQAKEASGPLLSLAAGELARQAIGTNKNLFTRTTGAVVNPNMELLFEGPKLREGFQFNFSLSAREPKEAKEIKKIIRFFKQGMSVKRAASTLFLKAPNTFTIKYVYGRTKEDHPWINRIKECALTNFTVNYTPAGNYATFEDGAMTQYDITLSFSELDPIYDDDYTALDGDADNDIGY